MKIGLVPMSAKPYHAGHHALVTAAASENDSVLLFISTTDRTRKGETPIKGSDMYSIWLEHIESILPSNVTTVYGGSPIRKVYDELGNAEQGGTENTYVVYSDPVDTAKNFPEANRLKYFPTIYDEGRVIFAAEENPAAFTRGEGTPNVSGTSVRQSLGCGDYDEFSAAMPQGLDTEAVYNKLCPLVQKEGLVRKYIRGVLISG
jgi:hypothetical protein